MAGIVGQQDPKVNERPSTPSNIRILLRTQTSITFRWDAPENAERLVHPISRYELREPGQAWLSTGSSDPSYLLERLGDTVLSAHEVYRLQLRAVNALGAGTPTDVFELATAFATIPSAPRFPAVHPYSATAIQVRFQTPLDTGGSVSFFHEFSISDQPEQLGEFERLPDGLSPVLRGFLEGQQFFLRLRTGNEAGTGPATEPLFVVVREPPVFPIVDEGRRIPLLPNALRQSMILRLQGMDCRLRVWWQPYDGAWYGSLEIPANTVAVAGRRIAVNTGLLDHLSSPLDGNVVCRALDSAEERIEPDMRAWATPTHALFWEES